MLSSFEFGPVVLWREGAPVALLRAEPHDEVVKTDAPNERWITLKPHGEGDHGGGYVHVKIRVSSDGSGHVVQGPGELRGLRLTRLASPEQLKARKVEREAARREKKKQDEAKEAERAHADLERSASDPEFAASKAAEKLAAQKAEVDKHAHLDSLAERMASLRERMLDKAAAITGDGAYQSETAEAAFDPDAYDEYKNKLRAAAMQTASAGMDDPEEHGIDAAAVRGAGAVIASRNVRAVRGALAHLKRHLISSLVKDADLRAAVLHADDDVDPSSPARVTSNPGYARRAGGQAAERGYTPDDARAEATEAREDRLARLQADGQGERANAIREMVDKTRARAAAERELKSDDPTTESLNQPKPLSKPDVRRVAQHAEHVRDFLKLHHELDALEREERALRLGSDPDATKAERDALEAFDKPPGVGAEIGADVGLVERDFAAKLERDVQGAAQADVTRAFLDAVDEDAPHQGYAENLIRKAMTAAVGSGAHGHLANASLAVLGSDVLDRQVVDVLGVDAGAQLLAHALARDLEPERLAEVRAGLAAHHDETSVPRMRDAVEFARAARADAAEIEVPNITSGMDAALVAHLARERKARLSEAHDALGTALGAVEAGAALNLALKGAPKSVVVRFGDAPTASVVTNLRALGLGDGDYDVHRDTDTNELRVRLSPSGMNRLTHPADDAHAKLLADARAIKDGAEDEPGWLPAGFEARMPSDLAEHPELPPAFTPSADFSRGAAGAVEGVAGALYADGARPSEVLRHLLDHVAPTVPGEHAAEFSREVAALLPFARDVEKTARDGTRYTSVEAADLDRDDAVHARLGQLAEAWLSAHHPGEAAFHAQRVDDTPQVREAAFRVLADEPTLGAAFTPLSDLGGDAAGRERAAAVRSYFLKKLHGLTGNPKEHDEAAREKQLGALSDLGEPPQKWGGGGGDLFSAGGGGDAVTLRISPHATSEEAASALRAYGLTPEHYELSDAGATLNDAGKRALRVPDAPPVLPGGDARVIDGGLDDLNPAWVTHQKAVRSVISAHPTTSDIWKSFVETVGSRARAFEAVQDVMRGDFAARFAEHHAHLTGRQLRVSKATAAHWEPRLAFSDPAERDRLRARDRALMERLRERGARGQYAAMGEGGLAGAVAAHVEKMSRQSQLQGGLGFDLASSKGGGEVTAARVHDLDVGAHERVTLGRSAEAALARLVNTVPLGVKPGDGKVDLIHGLDWSPGSKHVGKQRGVKFLLRTGRLLGFYGAGSGKTAMQIGGFTEAHARGEAKKALLVVPSIVRNQFGEEAAKFTTPGRYSWHARDDSFEGRKAAYTGDTHMVVVTHATFRDDMMRLMAEHQNVSVAEMHARFEAANRPARAAMLRAATEHHGIPLHYLAVDEAHDFLNRAGKEDSAMSRVLEAAMDNAKFKSLWTGSPVKNDASEIHDWLMKVDPAHTPDRETFMRRYGVKTKASAEALQRLMDGYSYVDSVTPDVRRTVVWGARGEDGEHRPIPLTPAQEEAYRSVHAAFQRASAARARGDVDVDALKVLSPRSFDGVPDEEHRGVAAGLTSALGTLKHAALGRVVNEFAPEHNAKVQHVLSLAEKNRGRGGVIFAHGRRSVAMLREELEARGVKVGVIDGSTTTDDKGRVRQAFDRGEVDVVVCSDAGATGANLQKRGRWLVNYDLPLTQKTLEQRNARIDRLGQRDPIELHHLATDTAYDRDNVKRLERKRELGSILQGEYRSLEDTGLASYLVRARAERAGDAPVSFEEPLSETPSEFRLTDDGPVRKRPTAADFAHETVEWGDTPTPEETSVMPSGPGLFG